MIVLEVLGPEGSTDQISFSVIQPEFETIKVNFYIGKLVRYNLFKQINYYYLTSNYMYHQTGDTTRPKIDYIFNGDCRFADTPHTCSSEKWNIEATIQDENSGKTIQITWYNSRLN